MPPLTIVASYQPGPRFEQSLASLAASPLVDHAVVVCRHEVNMAATGCRVLIAGPLSSGRTLGSILDEARTDYLLLLPGPGDVSFQAGALERMMDALEAAGAGILYSDYYEEKEGVRRLHPLIDYQPGSGRDDFDFGPMMLVSVRAAGKALGMYGPVPEVEYGGLYDLRLKISIDHPVHHLGEALYSVTGPQAAGDGETEGIFAYVDPRNAGVQKEMEGIFTGYLREIGAYLPASDLKTVLREEESFPVEASVIIPVRNRQATIAGAVESALSQEADFPFNVIVVDNHSSDGTTAVLAGLAARHRALVHMVPERADLAIGGCWNEAVQSGACGRYAVQLDSDDLYTHQGVLKEIVHMLATGGYAMVVGSYTIVDFNLRELPPGLIDHREWTDRNGHNNALRINGLGAPRAFDTRLMRTFGFLNVSYGEDYAAALRVCREYRIGRIYESLYLCRRWSGNTDAQLSIEETNRNNLFKDKVRTEEIEMRKKLNEGRRTWRKK